MHILNIYTCIDKNVSKNELHTAIQFSKLRGAISLAQLIALSAIGACPKLTE